MRTAAFAALLFLVGCASETIDTVETEQAVTVSAISRGSTWRYWDHGGSLGTAWRGTYDDAAWSSGAGPLGFGETYVRTAVASGPITTYFRHTFTVDDPATITRIAGEVMYDDGFVVYLNGTEIARAAMPTGTITGTTLSSGHEAANAYTSYDWTSQLGRLVQGTNTIAVEVHQVAASSSDLVFDLALSLEASTPPPPPGANAWFYWDNGGDLGTSWRTLSGAATGWDLGDGPLGFGESYLHTTTANGPITTYFRRTITVDDPARVGSILGEVMYDDGFVAYLNGVEIQRVAMPAGAITASTQSSGHEAGNAYTTYDWSARRDLLVAGANVIAFEVHQAGTASSDLVFDARVTLEDSPPPPVELDDGIDRAEYWVYWSCTTQPPSDWALNGFGSSCWSSGKAPIGYGETYLATTVPSGPITHYFYNDFLVDNPTAVTSMLAEVMYDDGFVVYLNGVEVARRAMPSGAVSSTTLSTGHEAENTYVTVDLTGFQHLLKPSFNRISIEVHQASASSSDLVMDLALRLFGEDEDPPPPETGDDIARGSTWRFWDQSAPGWSWGSADYDDSQWRTGAAPIGFGESYIVTDGGHGAITTYFRRTFTVDNPTVRTRLLAELRYDDGVIVYLNGSEIQRLSMPDDTWINDQTLAMSHEATSYEAFDWTDSSGLLVSGVNVLSVEVHQSSSTSSDLVFDLSLSVDTPSVCAVPGGGPAVAPSPHIALEEVWVTPSTVYAIGNDGVFGRRSSTGEWCWSRPIEGAAWSGLWGAGETAWLIGDAGRVVRYDGTSFTPVEIGTSQPLTDIWGTGADDLWITGRQGIVRRFDGTSWTAHDLPGTSVYAVWTASPDDVWISGSEYAPYPGNSDYDGSSGVIYRWVPATGTWNLERKITMYYGAASYDGLHGTSATDIWAIGLDHPAGAACGISTLAHWDGTTWSYVQDAPTECADLEAISAGGPGAEDGAWLGGWWENGSGTNRYTGGAWSSVAWPTGINGIHYLGDRLYAVGYDSQPGQYVVRWDGTQFVREW